jgi:hypothetical protein
MAPSFWRHSSPLALLGVGERLVRSAQILELAVGAVVVRIAVGVHLFGQSAVRLLDLVDGSRPRHAQDLVKVPPEMAKITQHLD